MPPLPSSTRSPASAPTGAPSVLARRAAISSLAVFGSRLLGLLREQIFAYFFGAGRAYDAFLTAFRIPNLLRDLLAEGALSSAFVAVFSRELQASGKARAFAVANAVMRNLLWLLGAITLLGIYFAPSLVAAMAVGFDADKAALTVTLARLMFPFILFVALAALCMGMLNAQGFFALPQSASSFFNLTSIVVGLGCAYALAPQYMACLAQGRSCDADEGAAGRAMVGMAMGTLVGGLVQWAVQLPLLWRQGWRPQAKVAQNDPALAQILRLLAPAVVGAAAVQLSVFINSNFASTLGDRAISWLSYSFRLMQFPIGLFGVAIMTASLPTLARQAGQNDRQGFADTLTQALELVLLLTLPAAVLLISLAQPIVRLVFEHGRFSAQDTRACAASLAAYAVGLPGYSALKVLQPAFVAQGDARTPMVVTLVGVGASVALNAIFVLGCGFGHVGLACSTSALATGSSLALLGLLRRKIPGVAQARLWHQGLRIGVAAASMGAVVAALHHAAMRWPFAACALGTAAELLVLLPLAAVLYFGLGRVLRVDTLHAAQAMLMRRLLPSHRLKKATK